MNAETLRRSLGYYRPVLVIAFAAFFCELGFSTINVSTLPMYLSVELHAVKWLGLILGLQTLCDTLSRPFLGALGDRVGRRWIIIAGPLLSAVTAAVTVYISVGVLVGFRIIDGLAMGALWTSVFAETGDITDVRHRNTAMSLVNVAFIMALALGPLAGGLLDHAFQNRFSHFGQPAFLFSAVCLLVGSGVAFTIFRPKRRERAGDIRGVSRLGFEFSDLLYTVRTFPGMMLLALLIYCGLGLIMPLIKLYAVDRYGISELAFGKVLAIEALIMAAAAVPLSKLSGRWGVPRTISAALLWTSGSLWLLTYAKAIGVVFLSSGMIALGFITAMPAWLAFITEVAPSARKGEVLGVLGLSEGLGVLVGASLAGLLFDLREFRVAALGVTALNLPFFMASVVTTISAVASHWLFSVKRMGSGGNAGGPADAARPRAVRPGREAPRT